MPLHTYSADVERVPVHAVRVRVHQDVHVGVVGTEAGRVVRDADPGDGRQGGPVALGEAAPGGDLVGQRRELEQAEGRLQLAHLAVDARTHHGLRVGDAALG